MAHKIINKDGQPVPHCELSDRIQRKARAALRKEAKKCSYFQTDNLDADVIIEQVWNALTGLDSPQ